MVGCDDAGGDRQVHEVDRTGGDSWHMLAQRLRVRVGVSGWNFIVSSSGDVGTKLLGLVSTVMMARALQPERFGVYSTILAFMTLGLSVGNLGLDRLLLRELSASLASLQLYATARVVRYAIVPLVMVGMVIYGHHSGDDVLPWLIGGLALFPALSSALLMSLFQAREWFSVPARGALVQAAVSGIGVIACALARAPLVAYLGVFVVSESSRQWFLRRQSQAYPWPSQRVEWQRLRPMLHAALPYALLTVLGIVYLRVDVVMLDAMIGSSEVGLYAGATRVLMLANALPGLCLAVLFPRFVRLQESDPARSARLYLLAVRVMVWIGAPIALGFALGAQPLMTLLYGPTYAGGAGALRWLMAALLFMFWHAPNGTVLFSSERLRPVILISVATAGFNVVANLYAIPRWGAEGAAFTTAASELLSFALFTPLVCRRLSIGATAYVTSALTPALSRTDRHLLLDIRS